MWKHLRPPDWDFFDRERTEALQTTSPGRQIISSNLDVFMSLLSCLFLFGNSMSLVTIMSCMKKENKITFVKNVSATISPSSVYLLQQQTNWNFYYHFVSKLNQNHGLNTPKNIALTFSHTHSQNQILKKKKMIIILLSKNINSLYSHVCNSEFLCVESSCIKFKWNLKYFIILKVIFI